MFTGSIPALVTPMLADGAIDLSAWDRLLDFHLEEGSDALVVGGTTGESPTLDRAELEELIRRARRRAAGRVPVIAGSGTNGTAKAIALSRLCESAGADALLLVTPYYNRPTQLGMRRHFEAIADSVGIPVILYNVPGRTACDLLPATVLELAAHPRIVGIKEATGDLARIREIVAGAPTGFDVLSGDDPTAGQAMQHGACGVISVTANVAPRAMHQRCAAALAGRHADAGVIDAQLAELHTSLFVEPNPIPAKWALERLGLIGPGIRLPLTPLSAERRGEVEAAMRAAGIKLP
jgi:4-hydroxy-tetrahydrodipicolinate synthase